MSELFPTPLQELADEFSSLPSIGKKNALRLALHVFSESPEFAKSFSHVLEELHQSVQHCTHCFHVSEREVCSVCSDTRRELSLLCIVEHSLDVLAIEQSGQYRGLYHVLGGVLSPADGVGPRQLHLSELEDRVKKSQFGEIIIATNPSMEGEATANYVARILKQYDVRVTRLARGMPTGGVLEYTDERTLGSAFEGRKEL